MKCAALPWVCLAAILATGCPGPGDTGELDADGDHSPATDDCDDDNALVYPGAEELCDGLDNDCDGEVDEYVADLWFADEDGDGYGDSFSTMEACEQPSGWVADNSDCDDTNDTVYPGADELCDGLDNDCDSDWDEDAIDATAWYPDADGDGYGPDDQAVVACEQPDDHVAQGGDCEDSDDGVYPGADEYCDQVDNDCDGEVDEDDALDPLTFFQDDDGDGYGLTDLTTLACSPPSGFAAVDGDCDDGDASVHPGADEYCDDIDQDCDGETNDDDAVDAPFWYDDMDGDGYGDPSTGLQQCEVASGQVSDDLDCDDDDASIHPDADEYCNELDDNCDGTVDEDSAVDATAWYLDSDGDDFGDESAWATACAQPSGYAEVAGDCDDTVAEVNPDAIQFCGDGVDDDCRGADTTCPMAGDLLITELMKDPAAMSDSSGEWLEIHNTTASTIELEGLIIYDHGTEDWLIDQSLQLEAGGYAVLSRSSTATTATDLVWSGFQLVNSADAVILALYGTDGTDGDVLHEVVYDDVDWPDVAGASLSLDPGAFTPASAADPTSWCAGQTAYDTGDLGTPGAANDSCP